MERPPAANLPPLSLRDKPRTHKASRDRVWLAALVVALSVVCLWPVFRRDWTPLDADSTGPVPLWRDLAVTVGWIPALILSVWLAARPFRALGVLFFLCAASGDFFEGFHLQAPFMKVYLPDILIPLALAGIVLGQLAKPRGRPVLPRTPLNLPLGVYCAAGLVFLAWGLTHQVPFDRALGDFRRSFFYAAVFFLVLWETRRDPRAAWWIGGGFLAGACVQIVTGFLTMVSRNFYQMHFADVFHVLSHLSTTLLGAVFYLGLAAFLTRRSAREHRWAVGAVGVVVVLVVVANFRAAWLGLAAGSAVCFLRTPGAILRVRRFVLPAIAAALVAVLLLLALGNLAIAPGATLRTEIENKVLRFMDYRNDPNVRWRIDSYRAALATWAAHPVMGRGLGYLPEFYAAGRLAGAGSYLVAGHRVHNSYLWFLAATGSIGGALFVWVQVALLRVSWSGAALTRLPRERLLFLALLGFHVHFLTVTAFHHLFESIVTVLALYGLAGVVLGMAAREKGTGARLPHQPPGAQ
ncbi:O-antigen ligase family protein [Candidatus Sumerlaeota bacterium]|nr:O-antigen ligase family protein [Candidatus Sumerlaeota bacterium]